MELHKNLAWLCRSNGWLYVVVWGVDQRDRRLLVVEDAYFEQQVEGAVCKMMNMIHLVGEGIVGETASSGITRWLYDDDYKTDLCTDAEAINLDFFKTTVLIPISSGVAQFGSAMKIPESFSFVEEAKSFFARKEHRLGLTNVQHGTFPSTSSSENTYNHCDNSNCGLLISDGMFRPAPSSGLLFNTEPKRFNQYYSNPVDFCNQVQTSLLGPNPTSKSTSEAQDTFVPSTRLLSPSRYDGSSVCFYADNYANNSIQSAIHHVNMINPFSGNERPQPDLISNEIILKETPSGTISVSSSTAECYASTNKMASQLGSLDDGHYANNINSAANAQLISEGDLFDITELNFAPDKFLQDFLDDLGTPSSCPDLSASASECFSEPHKSSLNVEGGGLFSDLGLEQLLNSLAKENTNATWLSSVAQSSDYHLANGAPEFKSLFSSAPIPSVYDPSLPKYIQDVFEVSKMEASPNSTAANTWNIDDKCSMNNENSVLKQTKQTTETEKVKKRARPAEGTKPRPKDRQLIQDRVKELRDIVPNGKKCSIDSLLNHTIKYMLFMQSVMKYAEKIKPTNEPKMIGEENGVILKDNSGSDRNSATWAYEVAGQTMICPLIVEDLTPPGQMLVEMLCEDRGLFLEIADTIRGFGLTILKGVMEISEQKIWARFLVEANKDVTRMDIFLSLIQLLQQTSGTRASRVETEVFGKETPLFTSYQQATMPIPVGLSERSH